MYIFLKLNKFDHLKHVYNLNAQFTITQFKQCKNNDVINQSCLL